MFSISVSNQITKSYYFSLVEQINNGTCSKSVCKILRRNGNYEYETYHLTSVM